MNMTTEKSEKNLLMNVSKDEMDTIDEILQSRQPEILPDKKTSKLPVASRSFISGSKLIFPISVLLQASGVLSELNTVAKQSKTGTEDVASDDGNDLDDNFSYENTPENLEDLILLEHNYAVKYSALKSKENESLMETEAHGKCNTKQISEISSTSEVPKISSISEVPKISSISKVPEISSISKESEVSTTSEVPEISSISPPIRRSKRQIEKLERELVAAANVDALDHEVPKEKLVKHEEKKSDDKDTKSLKIETNLNSDIKVSNYKSFAEFKKRHLKVIVEDCKNMKNVEVSAPIVLSNSAEEILHDSMDSKCKNDSFVDVKDIQNLTHSEPQAKSKYLRKTKLHKPTDLESDEKSTVHSPNVKKKKCLNLIPNSNDSSPKKSSECEEKSDKNANKNVLKEKKKTIVHIKQKDLTHLGKKRKKHVSSSAKLPSNSEFHQVADSPVSKRKKCVSFSEDLLLSDKLEAIPRKQRISFDCKESHQKSALSSPSISTAPISKVHKKKILKRDSLRLISDDGPALFSQPDVMIKVSADDNANKKDEKESDSSDRPSKEKTTDMPTVIHNPKESFEMKEKQMLKEKLETSKISLKAKQEVIKIMQEEKGKQTSKQ